MKTNANVDNTEYKLAYIGPNFLKFLTQSEHTMYFILKWSS